MAVTGSITYNGQQIVDFSKKSSGTLKCGGKKMATDVYFTISAAESIVTVIGNSGSIIKATNGTKEVEGEIVSGTDSVIMPIEPEFDGELWTFTSSFTHHLIPKYQNITSGERYTVDTYNNPIFGDGSDGAVTLSSDLSLSAINEDYGYVEKNYISLDTNDHNITMANRNSGLIIRTQGNCNITINTVITNIKAPRSHSADLSTNASMVRLYPNALLTGAGGNGGKGGYGNSSNASYVATTGAGQAGRYYGGGYSGGGHGGMGGYFNSFFGGSVKYTSYGYIQYGIGGSAATINLSSSLFVGGAGAKNVGSGNSMNYGSPGQSGGGGGGATGWRAANTSGAPGGQGGNSAGAAGSSSGLPSSANSYAGGGGGAGNFGGGVVIIYCGGDLTIRGTINCSGSPGGNAGYGGSNKAAIKSGTFCGCGGGGGGGGRIYIGYHGTFNNFIRYNISGGAAGTSYYTSAIQATAGTAGTYSVEQI